MKWCFLVFLVMCLGFSVSLRMSNYTKTEVGKTVVVAEQWTDAERKTAIAVAVPVGLVVIVVFCFGCCLVMGEEWNLS